MQKYSERPVLFTGTGVGGLHKSPASRGYLVRCAVHASDIIYTIYIYLLHPSQVVLIQRSSDIAVVPVGLIRNETPVEIWAAVRGGHSGVKVENTAMWRTIQTRPISTVSVGKTVELDSENGSSTPALNDGLSSRKSDR